MTLCGRISKTEDLTENNIDEMFILMKKYYKGIDRKTFLEDLSEKKWAILLEDTTGIKGFSTQMLIEHTIEDKKILAVYSGDTIIDRAYWSSFILPVTWVRMMRAIKAKNPEKLLYWFLISKGYRTYRFLPTFFKSYFPAVNKPCTDFEKKLLRELATEKFSSQFNPKTYIIKAPLNSQKLKIGVGDISEQQRKNKHIAFFEESNPGYVKGDELACIARFDENNLTSFIMKRTEQPIGLGA
jgi:hypothetical protein